MKRRVEVGRLAGACAAVVTPAQAALLSITTLRTHVAKPMGIRIPTSVLLRATQVIA